MKLILFALLLVSALLLACGGGDASLLTKKETPAKTSSSESKTPAGTAKPKATSTKAAAAIPAKPADFSGYPSAVASYLNDAGESALEGECLKSLFQKWDMPWDSASPSCIVGNTDGDSEDEVAVLLSDISTDSSSWQVVVFDSPEGVYKTAYESEPVEVPGGNMPEWRTQLLEAGDINGDGNGELVYTENTCGASTCSVTVRILTGGASGYDSLSGDDISMASANVSLEDKDGDGSLEVVLHGGELGSIGAGPQRTRTDVYAWNGSAYKLKQTLLDPTDILYLHVTEADSFFTAGHYDASLSLYQEALNDPSLKTWKEQADMVAPERPELSAYMLFRMGLSAFGAGSNNEGQAYVQQAVDEYGGNLHGDMAKAFLDSYKASHDLPAACTVVDAFIADNLNLLEAFWDYGYGNPSFNADSVCPF